MPRRFIAPAVLVLTAITACAATPDYYPLAVGNTWAYHGEGAAKGITLVIQVHSQSFTINGAKYFAVAQSGVYHPWLRTSDLPHSPSPGGDRHMYQDEDGAVWAYTGHTPVELWYDFGGKHSSPSYSTSRPGAAYGSAKVHSGTVRVTGVMGECDALLVEYPVAPYTGVEKEWFVAGIGMVQQQVVTDKGVATFRLASWRIAAPQEGSSPETSLTLALDRPFYRAGLIPGRGDLPETLLAHLTFRNNSQDPVKLVYPDCQKFEMAIWDSSGTEVHRSYGSGVCLALTTDLVNGEVSYLFAAPLVKQKKTLRGPLTAEAWLTTSRDPEYSAKAVFWVESSLARGDENWDPRATFASLPAASVAASPDYFPLAVGSVWAYEGADAAKGVTLAISVDSSKKINGHTYYEVTRQVETRGETALPSTLPLLGSYWLRQDESGRVWAYDAGSEEESLWCDFGGAQPVRITGAMGERDALLIEYPASPSPGLEKEWFVPGIGLVEQRIATANGPAAFRLAAWHIAEPAAGTPPGVSFTIALDRPVYSAGLMPPAPDPAPTLVARLTARNNSERPIDLTYPTSQRFELVIRDANGVEVFRWSKDKSFTPALETEPFTGEKSYVVAAPLIAESGSPLPNGRYTAEGSLATSSHTYSARVRFEIANTF